MGDQIFTGFLSMIIMKFYILNVLWWLFAHKHWMSHDSYFKFWCIVTHCPTLPIYNIFLLQLMKSLITEISIVMSLNSMQSTGKTLQNYFICHHTSLTISLQTVEMKWRVALRMYWCDGSRTLGHQRGANWTMQFVLL